MTEDTQIIQRTPDTIELIHSPEFSDNLSTILRIGLKPLSDKNRKEYLATFKMWETYATKHGFHKYHFQLEIVEMFLTINKWSFNTRKVRLAHIRRFAELLSLADTHNLYGYGSNFATLNLLKPKALGGTKSVINKRALSNKQVYKIFDCWDDDNYKSHRNRAILGLMLIAGLRANEVLALRWEHVNWDESTIHIAHGKGDKSGDVPMLGSLKQLLRHWFNHLPENEGFNWVCVSILRSGKLVAGETLSTATISRIVKDTTARTGIKFKPHDTRRTAITHLLNNGATIAATRDFARHESNETTLIYAQGSIAKELGTELNKYMRYGDVLSDMKQDEQAINWECSNNHKWLAVQPTECPTCFSKELSYQTSIFD